MAANLNSKQIVGTSLTMSVGKITDIQVFRAVAALMVLLQHLSLTPTLLTILTGKNNNDVNGYNLPFYIGVEFFFLISGYVVTSSLLRRGGGALAFCIRRAFRLLPAMLFFFVVSMLAWITYKIFCRPDASFTFSWSTFFFQMASVLFGVFINTNSPALYTNGAMWTLSVEFQFYLFLALFWFMASHKKIEPFRNRLLLLINFIVLLCCSYFRVKALRFSDESAPVIISYLLMYKIDFLCAGVLIAYLKPIKFLVNCKTFLILLPMFLIAHTPLGSRFEASSGMIVCMVCFFVLVWGHLPINALLRKGSYIIFLCI